MAPDVADLILQRMNRQDETLERIEHHVIKTNGRVTAIELSRAEEAAALAAIERVEASSKRRAAEYVGWIIAVAAILVGAYT